MKKLLILSLLFLCNCATLMPVEKRQKGFTDYTGLKKEAAFNGARVWFTRTFRDASRVIQYADIQQGKIVAKGYIPCEALKDPLGLIQANNLRVVIDLTIKDNKLISNWQNLEMFNDNYISESLNVTSEEKLNKVINECIMPVKASLIRSIKSGV